MKWCEVLGTEPYLCLNFGTGTLDEGMLLSRVKDDKPTQTYLICRSARLGRVLQWHR